MIYVQVRRVSTLHGFRPGVLTRVWRSSESALLPHEASVKVCEVCMNSIHSCEVDLAPSQITPPQRLSPPI